MKETMLCFRFSVSSVDDFESFNVRPGLPWFGLFQSIFSFEKNMCADNLIHPLFPLIDCLTLHSSRHTKPVTMAVVVAIAGMIRPAFNLACQKRQKRFVCVKIGEIARRSVQYKIVHLALNLRLQKKKQKKKTNNWILLSICSSHPQVEHPGGAETFVFLRKKNMHDVITNDFSKYCWHKSRLEHQ